MFSRGIWVFRLTPAFRLTPGVKTHSRCSVSSVKRSARSATVSTAASECFMAVLV